MARSKQRLNQVVALVAGRKATAEQTMTQAYHLLQKGELFNGMARTYAPATENGAGRDAERKNPQASVLSLYAKVEAALVDMFDAVATQDWGNCLARADVVVDGKVMIEAAPVPFLLFLDKKLTDLRTFCEKLPVRDGAEDWEFNAAAGMYSTSVRRKQVTQKNQVPLVLYNATPEHPAQTQLITKDEVCGHWEERNYSTAVAQTDKDTLLARIAVLTEAVKVAREEANAVVADEKNVGAAIMSYVFGGVLKRDATKTA